MQSVCAFLKDWLREWWGLMSCAAFTFLTVYVAATNRSNPWAVGGSAVLGFVFFFVASYRAWKRQNDLRIETEARLEKALMAGPVLSLGFNNVPLAEKFYVENRGEGDASLVSIDPFETPRYRAESGVLAAVRHSERPQVLEVRMIDKEQDVQFVDLDLVEMLKDTAGNGFHCLLEFTLRYSDQWGKRFKRKATLTGDRLNLDLASLPRVLNYEIEIDRDAPA